MKATLRFLQQENARLQEENQRLQDELGLLREYLKALSALENAADRLSSEQEFFPLLHKILYYALSLLDATDGSVALLDRETEELIARYTCGRAARRGGERSSRYGGTAA